uniref:Uncharacterized protein n=1 Tax=Nesodiprion zhejiangensis nucleopolyhedrovirus TaxID=3135970 RepID=A0AAN0LI75_9BACU
MVKIKKISSGADHFVLLSKCGRLYTMGNNEQNQLARPSRCLRYYNEMIPKYIQNNCIDAWATPYATFVKNKNDNRVYACGLNNHGQLGVYNILNNPISYMYHISCFIRNKYRYTGHVNCTNRCRYRKNMWWRNAYSVFVGNWRNIFLRQF